jgi:hypothetical protein
MMLPRAQQMGISKDPALSAQVTRVGRRIAEATGKTDFQWEVTVIEDKQVIQIGLGGNTAFAQQATALLGAGASWACCSRGAARRTRKPTTSASSTWRRPGITRPPKRNFG